MAVPGAGWWNKNQPGSVTLLFHAMLVPLEASESKFCV
jgi:hypothetical protein